MGEKGKVVLAIVLVVALIVLAYLFASGILMNWFVPEEEAPVVYDYRMTLSDEVYWDINWNNSTRYAETGHTYVICDIKVHNNGSEQVFISNEDFVWSSQGTEFEPLNPFVFYHFMDPEYYEVSGYVQHGEDWEIELIYHVPDAASQGFLSPTDSSWALDISL